MGQRGRTPGGGTWLRPLSIATFAVLAGASITIAVVIGRLADQQDERLVEARTSEVSLFLDSSMREVELTFPFLQGVLLLAADRDVAFQVAGGNLLNPIVRGVAMAAEVDGELEVTALVGEGPAVGAPLDDAWAALLARTQDEGGVVTAAVSSGDEGTRVGLATQPDGLPILLLELLFDPENVIQQEPGSAFSDISGAVYVGNEQDPTALVLTTTDELPLTGEHVQRDMMTIGNDEWLVVATSDGSLVGPLADRTQVGVLIGGLVLAFVTAALVELLGRRRAYAMRIVEERTAELEQAREVAEDANSSKTSFLSRVSHELRTPLNAVIGFGQVLELDPLEPRQRESVEQILKGGRHLLELINEVLDISRIEAGELALSPEPVHVMDVVQEAAELIQPLADQRGIEMDVDQSGLRDCYVLADRQRTRQILLNLQSNAVTYNVDAGSVRVACEPAAGRMVRIDVTDSGPGIAPELAGKLFTAFERLGAESTGVEGTGIGLSLSRQLAEAMGGRLVADTAPGQGSTFSVVLPGVDAPDADAPTTTGDRVPTSVLPDHAEQVVVLHVEDNPVNAKLVERIASQRPEVRVVPAMQGRLGLQLARDLLPALVLLDLHLPDIGGDEVLRELKADPATASIPVVVVSADATPGRIPQLLEAGAAAYLTKPFDVQDLLDVIDDAVSAARRHAES